MTAIIDRDDLVGLILFAALAVVIAFDMIAFERLAHNPKAQHALLSKIAVECPVGPQECDCLDNDPVSGETQARPPATRFKTADVRTEPPSLIGKGDDDFASCRDPAPDPFETEEL